MPIVLRKNALPILLITLSVPLCLALVLFLGWYSVIISATPLFIWLSMNHFKQSTSAVIFLFTMVHLLAFTVMLSESSAAAFLRFPTFLILVGIVSISFIRKKRMRTFQLPAQFKVLMFTFFVVLALGSLRSFNPSLSVQYFLWFIVFIVFIFNVIPQKYNSVESIMTLLYAFILAGFIYEIASIFTLSSSGIVLRGGNIAIRGLFSNNNTTGMISFLVSALSVVLLMYKQYLYPSHVRIVKLSAIISPVFVLLSSSRSSTLALLTTLILLGFVEKKFRKLSVFVLVSLVLLLLFAQDFLNVWFRTDTLGENGVFGERTELYSYVLRSFDYIPWYGLGIGMQETLYLKSSAVYLGPASSVGIGFHNSFLQILVETGPIGFVLFIMILLSTFRKLLTTKDASARKMIALMCAVLVGMMVNCFFESALLLPGSPYSLQFWILICLVRIVHYRSKRNPIISDGAILSTEQQR